MIKLSGRKLMSCSLAGVMLSSSFTGIPAFAEDDEPVVQEEKSDVVDEELTMSETEEFIPEEEIADDMLFDPFDVMLTAVNDEEQAAVDELIGLIAELQSDISNMTSENYPEYWARINTIRKKYNDLSYYGKAAVGNVNLQVLTSSERAYYELEEADIEALNAAVDALEDLNNDNYLEACTPFVEAREAYEKLMDKMSVLNEGDEDSVAKYEEIQTRLTHAAERLEEIQESVDGFAETTAQDFINSASTDLDFEITELGEGEALAENYTPDGNIYITRFVSEADYNKFLEIEEYVNTVMEQYNVIKASSLYNDMLENVEFKETVVEFLENYYRYRTDQLKVMYGDPDALSVNIKNADLWDDSSESNTLYTYLKNRRELAADALDNAKELSSDNIEIELAEYIQYSEDLFAAMNITIGEAIDELVEAILPLTTSDEVVDTEKHYTEKDLIDSRTGEPYPNRELEFTLEDIDKVAAANNANAYFNQSILQYLYVEAEDNKDSKFYILFADSNTMENPVITKAKERMAELAAQELGKYDGIGEQIDEYGLDYMSGYDGSQDPQEFINGIKERISDIKSDELLQYYIKIGRMSEDEARNEIAQKSGTAEAKTTAFEEKLADILDLREKSDAALDAYNSFESLYFGYDFMQEQASEYHNFEKHEDVCNFVDNFIAAKLAEGEAEDVYNLDAVMGSFDEAVDTLLDYKDAAEAYSTKYKDDNFDYPEDTTSDPRYIAKSEMNEIKNLADILYKHIDMSEFTQSVNDMYDVVMGLEDDKEQIYLDSTHADSIEDKYVPVVEAKANCSALKSQYDNDLTVAQKYCVTRETEGKLSAAAERLEEWDTAIAIMEQIDAIDDETDIDSFIAAVNKATSAVLALSASGNYAINLIADAALDKLVYYGEFVAVAQEVMTIPPIVSEHQIKDYEDKITQAREDFDAINSDEYADISDFVAYIQKLLKDREHEMACALKAREIDMSINDLDGVYRRVNPETGEGVAEYVEAFKKVEETINDVVNSDMSMTFGMLLQYSKFTHHKEQVDELLISAFVKAVGNVGEVNYTSDWDAQSDLIGIADECYNVMNDEQKSSAAAATAKAKLEALKADLARCRKAAEDAKETIDKLNAFSDKLDEVYSTVYKPDRESYYDGIISTMDELDGILHDMSVADDDMKYAYEYMLANGIVDAYEMDCAIYTDRFMYYKVQTEIDSLWAKAQASVGGSELLDSTLVKECEDLYKALANFEYYYDTGKNQQELVENYSKLAWVRMQLNMDGDLYAEEFVKYMDNEGLMDIAADELSISYEDAIKKAAAMYYAMSSQVQNDYVPERYRNQITALDEALNNLLELYATRGGKAADINEDGKISIQDVVMIIDFALDNNIEPENTAQYLRADINEDNSIDINDVIDAIGMIEF